MSDDTKLIIGLEARVAQFEKNFAKAAGTADRQFSRIEGRAKRAAVQLETTMSSAADGVNTKLNRMSSGFSAATTSLKASLGGLAAAALGGFSTEFVKASVADLAKLQDAAERTGASAKFLQELGYAVKQSGGETSDAAAGLQKFSVNIAKAANEGGDLAKVFEANGVALRGVDGKIRPIADLLRDFANLLKNTSSEQNRLSLATDAFGRAAGPALVLALASGSKGLAEMAAEANAAGIVLGDELVKKAAALDDQFAKLDDRVSGVGKQLAVEFGGPVVSAGMETLLAYLRQLKQTIADIRNLDLKNLMVRPEVRNFISPPLVDQGADKTELERQAAEVRAEIRGIESLKLAPDVEGARVGNLKKDLADIEAAIKKINATPVSPDYTPSRTGLTVGGNRETVIPAGGAAGGGSTPFATGEAVAQFVRRVVAAESGGKANAKNPNSTATGAGQFIESTWLALFRKHYPEQARSMGESAILALRNDADISKNLIEKYAEENANALRNAGVAVTEANLHLAHFLGAGDAAKVLKAAPGLPLAGLVNPRSIAANPTILGGGRTTNDAIAYAERRATGTRLAAGDQTDPEKEADRKVAALKKVLDALGLEASAIGKTAEQARVLQEIQAAGVDLSSTEGQAIKAKVEDLYRLQTAQEAAAQSAEDLQRIREEFASVGADATKGIVADLRAGVSAAEAFKNALDRILSKLADAAIDSAFASLFSTDSKGPGGAFGDLFSIFTKGFDSGGYTGPGARKAPAGVVHKGEVVWSQKDVARAGGVSMVEAMRLGGYAKGGAVGVRPVPMSMPDLSIPKAAAGSGAVTVTYAPTMHVAQGADPRSVAEIRAVIAQQKADMPAIVVAEVKKAQSTRKLR